MVSISWVARALGADVQWDKKSKTVIINTEDTNEALVINLAKRDLAKRKDISEDKISLKRLEAVDWADTSLGYPEAGKFYAQVVTPGYILVLTDGVRKYEYNTDKAGTVILVELPTIKNLSISFIKQEAGWYTVPRTFSAWVLADKAKRLSSLNKTHRKPHGTRFWWFGCRWFNKKFRPGGRWEDN